MANLIFDNIVCFNINKDGETFEFRYAGISADGKETPDLGAEALAAIYANDDS